MFLPINTKTGHHFYRNLYPVFQVYYLFVPYSGTTAHPNIKIHNLQFFL